MLAVTSNGHHAGSTNTSQQDELEANPEYIAGLSWPTYLSWPRKVRYILEFPFALMRWLSTPPADGRWSPRRRLLAILHPPGLLTVFLVILLLCVADLNELKK
jgi:hypothetical protein